MVRLLPLCLVVASLSGIALAQDSDSDSIRSAFETQFEDLDQNADGQLDATEFAKLAPEVAADLKEHGLPPAPPVPRDVFVASGMALAAARTPPAAAEPPAGQGTAPNDKTQQPEAASMVATTGLVPIVRNSTKKSHFVPELPAEFVARDKNGDGQIALYEWERKKYSEFTKLDRNGDGFLTPAELLPKESLKSLYSRPPTRGGGAPAVATALASASPVFPGAIPGPSGGDDPVDREARGTFTQMDENKDGSIDEGDWGRSRRIRPWFESAGITVSLPLNADTFVTHYRRARESGGR